MKNKSIIAMLMVEGSDLIEVQDDIARLCRATRMLIEASDMSHEFFEKIEPIVKAMANSDYKLVRKHHYHKLNKVLTAEYMAC